MGNPAPQLKPYHWKKGQSANPGGRPKLPEELRAITSLTQAEVTKIISKYARMLEIEIDAIPRDTLTLIDAAIVSIFKKSIAQGDFTRLSFLLDRAIGKVPIVMEEDMPEDDQALNKLSTLELLKLVKGCIPDIKEKLESADKESV